MMIKFWQIIILAAFSVADTHNQGDNLSPDFDPLVVRFTSDFSKVRRSQYFVDKTLYIKEWFEQRRDNVYVTAPPRFGKSTALNMLHRFLAAEDTVVNGSIYTKNCNHTQDHKLFLGTKILEQEKTLFYKHFKQYTVIKMSLAPLGLVKNHEGFVSEMCYVIYEMFEKFTFLEGYSGLSEKHRKLLRRYGDMDMKHCLNHFNVAKRSGRHFIGMLKAVLKRDVILLGDDFDGMFYADLIRVVVEDFDDILFDLGSSIKSFIKYEETQNRNETVERAFFLGSLNLGGMITVLANNITHFDFFHDEKTAKFFGLSEMEARGLLKKFFLSDKYDVMEEWFDGYTVINSNLRLFNIISVICYITEGQKLESVRAQLSSIKGVTKRLSHLFSDHQIGFQIVESIFSGNTTILRLKDVQYTELIELKETVNCPTGSIGDYQLSPEKVSIFMTFLLEMGLFTVIGQNKLRRVIKPTNRENSMLLMEKLREAGYYDKVFRHDRLLKRNFKEALKRVRPNNESLVALAESVYKLFSKNPPNAEYPFMAVFFTYAYEASVEDKKEFLVDGEINVYRFEFDESKNKWVRKVNGTVDFVAYWEGELMLIIDGKCNRTAADGLDQGLRKRYYDLPKKDEFSKMKFKHLILAGLNIHSTSGTVTMNYLIDSIDVMNSVVVTCNENGTDIKMRRDMQLRRDRNKLTFL